MQRIFFVLYQMPIGHRIRKPLDIYQAFIAGYKLDIATATILLGIPLLLSVVFFISQHEKAKKACLYIIGILIIVYSATGISDAGLYREWNAKINMQALDHFKNPSEVFKTISPQLLFLFFLLLFLFSFPFIWLYRKIIHKQLSSQNVGSITQRSIQGTIYFLLSVGIGIILIRGGVTGIPINQSIAYFSNDVLANDIAVNPFYNILQDATIKSNIPETSVYTFRSHAEAMQFIADDYANRDDSSISILNESRPNLVFIFLESWSADNISVLGGIEGCTPQFNKLCNEGLLFSKAYAHAYVSDQGIPAVLSAYPSASRMAIINQPSKVAGLPCISEELNEHGYSSSFMFGGDLVYGNLRGYLLEKKFDELIEQKDFQQYPQGRLGVHDEYTFPELLKVLNTKKQPFLQGFFTVSSHMPYDYTPSDHWKSTDQDPEKLYTESMHYADIHLGKFFDEAKKQAWYQHTLFVVVADHSHNTIKQWNPSLPMHSHIPLLFTGGALKKEWQGKTWTNSVSHLDLAKTILHQLQIPATRYTWSRDVLNPSTPSSAYYVFFGGSGYINQYGYAASYLANPLVANSDIADSILQKNLLNKALSFQQLVFEDVRKR
ncbi:MAG: LTA synthase family protein [Bacteroidetes bacterium]|nr:LTA synthase family protein [Bacteroidota bacterium]